MAMFGPRMLAYSSTGPKLHLDSPAFAFSQLRVVLGSASGEWDYVSLEDPDGERRAWEWTKDRADLIFRVGRTGRYKLRYLIEGGYLTVGTVVESLDVDVRSPVRSFIVDRNVETDTQITVRWELEYVPPGCMFVFRRDRIRLAERTVTTSTGSATVPAPRAAGEFSFTLQGTNSRDSQMAEQPVSITCSRPFSLKLRLADTAAQSAEPTHAVIAAPGADVEVIWSGELIDEVDSIVICPSEHGSLANVLDSLRCSRRPAEHTGQQIFQAPRDVGLYSIVYGVRYNHVTIPAALAHLAVSDRLAPPGSWQPLAPPTADDVTVMLSGGAASGVATGVDEEARGHGTPLAQVLSSLLSPMMVAPAMADELYEEFSAPGGRGRERGRGHEDRSSARIGAAFELEEEGSAAGGGGGAGSEQGAAATANWGGAGGREMLCVVCLDSSVSVLIRPCNHVVLCGRCARSLKLCPMDRRTIEGRERIFLCQ